MSMDRDDTSARLRGKLIDLNVERPPEPVWTIGVTGRRYHPFSPDAGAICLKEISNNLSNQCRYHGAIDQFFSVTQHLVLAKRIVEFLWGPELGVSGLLYTILHDGAEAYMGDVIRPMKIWLREKEITVLDDTEALWQTLIHEHFGLPPTTPAEVNRAIKDVDEFLRYWELSCLKPPYAGWDALYGSRIRPEDFPPSLFEAMYDDEGRFWSPEKSHRIYLREVQSLLVQRGPAVYPHADDGFPRYL